MEEYKDPPAPNLGRRKAPTSNLSGSGLLHVLRNSASGNPEKPETGFGILRSSTLLSSGKSVNLSEIIHEELRERTESASDEDKTPEVYEFIEEPQPDNVEESEKEEPRQGSKSRQPAKKYESELHKWQDLAEKEAEVLRQQAQEDRQRAAETEQWRDEEVLRPIEDSIAAFDSYFGSHPLFSRPLRRSQKDATNRGRDSSDEDFLAPPAFEAEMAQAMTVLDARTSLFHTPLAEQMAVLNSEVRREALLNHDRADSAWNAVWSPAWDDVPDLVPTESPPAPADAPLGFDGPVVSWLQQHLQQQHQQEMERERLSTPPPAAEPDAELAAALGVRTAGAGGVRSSGRRAGAELTSILTEELLAADRRQSRSPPILAEPVASVAAAAAAASSSDGVRGSAERPPVTADALRRSAATSAASARSPSPGLLPRSASSTVLSSNPRTWAPDGALSPPLMPRVTSLSANTSPRSGSLSAPVGSGPSSGAVSPLAYGSSGHGTADKPGSVAASFAALERSLERIASGESSAAILLRPSDLDEFEELPPRPPTAADSSDSDDDSRFMSALSVSDVSSRAGDMWEPSSSRRFGSGSRNASFHDALSTLSVASYSSAAGGAEPTDGPVLRSPYSRAASSSLLSGRSVYHSLASSEIAPDFNASQRNSLLEGVIHSPKLASPPEPLELRASGGLSASDASESSARFLSPAIERQRASSLRRVRSMGLSLPQPQAQPT